MLSEAKCQRNFIIVSYLLLLGLGIYFGWHVSGILPRYALLVGLAAIGLVLGMVLMMLSQKTVKALQTPSCWVIGMHALAQGALGFALAYFLFKLNWKAALPFPIGAVTAALVWWAISVGNRPFFASLVSAALLAGPFAAALRLDGIQGAFLFGIGLLNAGLLGANLFLNEEAKRDQWVRAVIFGAFLVIGRAAIQYFLLTSNYANLGVVVTHPYSFVALFLGLILPIVYSPLVEERVFPKPVIWILLGVVLPIALGIFVHARPMGAYLMGLVASVFAVGLIRGASLSLAWLGYFSLAAVCFAYPLYKATVNLSRVLRLEILGGLFVLAVIVYFLGARRSETVEPAA